MKFYTNFPRQVGKYRNGIVNSMPDLVSYVNRWNGKMDLFTTIYAYHDWHNGKPDFDSAIIDKIGWDLDPKDDLTKTVEERTASLSHVLSYDSVPHVIKASGTGTWIYALTDDFPVAPDKKRATIRAIQEHYDDKAGGIKGDRTSYGDPARISRIIGSMNLKFRTGDRRYCVFVSLKSIEDGTWIDDYVKTGTHGNGYVKGNSPLNLAYWEGESENYYDSSNGGIYNDGVDKDVRFDTDWWCVDQAMYRAGNGAMHTNRDRFIILSHLYNTGYTSEQAKGIILNTFSSRNYFKIHEEGQVRNVYSRGLRFPSKTRLQSEGRCNNCGECEE